MRREADPTAQAPMFPLALAADGRQVQIRRVLGGHGLQRRLLAMGLAPGAQIRVVRNDHGGPLVIGVMDSRFMLGRGMAQHILVS